MDIPPTGILAGGIAEAPVKPAAPSPQALPAGSAGLGPALDAVVLATVEGVLTDAAGDRAAVVLRLLPPLSAEREDAALLAQVGTEAGRLVLATPLGLVVPRGAFEARPGDQLRFELLARRPLPAAGAPEDRPQSQAPARNATTQSDPEVLARDLLTEPGKDRSQAALLLLLAAAAGEKRPPRPQNGQRGADPGQGGNAAGPVEDRRVFDADSEHVWRVLRFPWLQPGLADARLLCRERDTDPGPEGETPARFLIEAVFRRFGAVQFDGLYRRGRFDLVLRSQTALPAEFRAEAGRRFQAALAIGNLAGALAFIVVPRFLVSARPAPRPLGLQA